MTYGAGGRAFTLILLAFFIPSVGLGRVGRARKRRLVDIGKGGARDAWQVFANGGVATVCAAIAGLSRTSPASPALWTAAFAGSYAAATADTWGTEIGTLAHGAPHSILTLRPIPPGLSGGVTVVGTAAEIAGAAWLAVVTAWTLTLRRGEGEPSPTLATTRGFIVPVLLGGIGGALVDSILGATLQELRRCPTCDRTCETNPHACGAPTTLVRGIRGFSNDVVNFGATLSGALIAAAALRAASPHS